MYMLAVAHWTWWSFVCHSNLSVHLLTLLAVLMPISATTRRRLSTVHAGWLWLTAFSKFVKSLHFRWIWVFMEQLWF